MSIYKDNKCNKFCIISSFLFCVIMIVIIVYLTCNMFKEFKHLDIHSQGYEVIDHLICPPVIGSDVPCLYNVVKYKDGCVENKRIGKREYFEEIGTITYEE